MPKGKVFPYNTAKTCNSHISSDSEDPLRWLRLVDPATLTFEAYGCGAASGLRFQPLNAVHHERFAVYLPIEPPTSP